MSALGLEHAAPQAGEIGAAFSASPSVLDRIRRKAAEGSEKHLDLLVPNYGGDIAVRYRAIDPERLEEIASKEGLNAGLDSLIACCEGILVQGDAGLEPLTKDGTPVTFSYGLDEILGLPTDCTARDVVLKLFSRVPSPHMAAGKHAMQLGKWMSGERSGQEEALLGES